MNEKKALIDHPIHEFLAERWSPYAFGDRTVSQSDLCSLFEAARWSASSYNEQPWSYIVATKEEPDHFQQLLSCLVEGNQFWAKDAPVLALGIASHKFARNGEDNRSAIHDLGLATGNLVVEATARGLCVHQMIGILPDKAREIFDIPTDSEAWDGDGDWLSRRSDDTARCPQRARFSTKTTEAASTICIYWEMG